MTMSKSEALVAAILEETDDEETGRLAFELLNLPLSGEAPSSDLHPLLQSTRASAVDAGAWVLSELGADAAAFMTDIDELLGSNSRKARFWAIDAVHAAASAADGATIAKAIQLIEDDDSAVRWKVLDLLCKTPEATLSAGLAYIPAGHVNDAVAWLIQTARGPAQIADVEARLDDADGTWRLVGAAAAFRTADASGEPLAHAATSADATIRQYAQYAFEFLRGRRSPTP